MRGTYCPGLWGGGGGGHTAQGCGEGEEGDILSRAVGSWIGGGREDTVCS